MPTTAVKWEQAKIIQVEVEQVQVKMEERMGPPRAEMEQQVA